jgi:hypothetical protein
VFLRGMWSPTMREVGGVGWRAAVWKMEGRYQVYDGRVLAVVLLMR